MIGPFLDHFGAHFPFTPIPNLGGILCPYRSLASLFLAAISSRRSAYLRPPTRAPSHRIGSHPAAMSVLGRQAAHPRLAAAACWRGQLLSGVQARCVQRQEQANREASS